MTGIHSDSEHQFQRYLDGYLGKEIPFNKMADLSKNQE